MRSNAHRLFTYDPENNRHCLLFSSYLCVKQIIQTPSGKCNRSQIPRLKVKFGDSPHNLQNLRDTRRAEQGRADNGLCRKIAAHYIFGAGDANISRFTIHPKRWNVLCKDKYRKKSSKNTEIMVKNRTFITKGIFENYSGRKR